MTAESGSPADAPAVFLPTVAGGAQPFGRAIVVPALIADVGPRAAKRFANFFGSIDNDNTRGAYQRACQNFFAWCDAAGLDELAAIEPIHVGAWVKSMAGKFEKPTVKQHLAAIRMLFDWLIVGQISPPIRPPPCAGRSTSSRRQDLGADGGDAQKLLDSIDVSTIVGLRDRALIALMTFTFARVVGGDRHARRGLFLRRQTLVGAPATKKAASSTRCRRITISKPISTPICMRRDYSARKELPCSAPPIAHGGALTALPMHRVDVWRMVRRRAEEAGIDADMCCHTFRTGSRIFSPTAARSKTPRPWPTMPARARRNSMTAPATKSRSTRSRGLRFDRGPDRQRHNQRRTRVL